MKVIFLSLFVLLYANIALASKGFIIQGTVATPNDEPLVGAMVLLEADWGSRGAVTDLSGNFQIFNLPEGNYHAHISHLGYESFHGDLMVDANTEIEIVLSPRQKLLKEVTVQDQRGATTERDASVSVDVVNADYLRTYDAGSLMHTLNRIPGIQSANVGSGQSKPLIRGLGFNRIIIAEHGIKHESQQWGADHALEIDQFANDHIELIKGPASLVYGSDAIGGVIQLSQRNIPLPRTLSGSVYLSGKSNNNLLGTSATLEGRKDRWYFTSRLTLLDYADTRVATDSVDVYSFRVPLFKNRLRNTAGNEFNLHFSAGIIERSWNSRLFISTVQQKAGFFANAHGLEPRRVDTELYDQSDRDFLYPRQESQHLKVVNRTNISLGRVLLIGEAGFQHNLRNEFSQYVDHGFRPAVFPDTIPIPSDLEREFDKYTLTANLRAKAEITDHHNVTFGFSSEYQDNRIDGISFLMPAYRQLNAGFFALHHWDVNKGTKLNWGIRYDHGNLVTDEYYDWFPTEGTPLLRASAISRQFSNLSGSVGINHQQERSVFRLNLGRSFRMPLAKELAANGVNYHHFSFEKGDSTLKAETAWQLDAGYEYTGNYWEIRLSPFVSYFPNYIYLSPGFEFDYNYGAGNQVFQYTAARVFRAGAEIFASVDLLPNLKLELMGEHTFSQQLSGAKKGFTIPFSPPASALMGLAWSPVKWIDLLFDWRLAAAQNRIVPPEKQTPSYQILSLTARGTMQAKGASVTWQVSANNLFNTHYLEHTSYYRLIGVPEPGRNFTFSLFVPFTIWEPSINFN